MRIVVCRPSHQPLVRDRKFIRTYQALGHDVVFVGNRRGVKPPAAATGAANGAANGAAKSAGVDCPIRYAGFSYNYFSRWVPLGTIGYDCSLLPWMVRLKPDLVHAGDFESLLPAALYKLFFNRRCKVVYDIADTYSVRYQIPRWLADTIQFVDDFFMSRCDTVVVPQDNRVRNFLAYQPRRCLVIPNCPYQADAPARTPWPAGPLRIMMSGHLAWARGIRQIVQAAQAAGGVRIVAVGLYAPGVREFLNESGIVEAHAEMPQHQVLALSRDCHLVAAYYDPSRTINRQAAPNKIFDAMAAARPVLLNSEIESAPQVVDAWRCGYQVGYHDIDSLRNLLVRVKQCPAEAEQLGDNGWRLFHSGFTWEAMSAKIDEYLGEQNGNEAMFLPSRMDSRAASGKQSRQVVEVS